MQAYSFLFLYNGKHNVGIDSGQKVLKVYSRILCAQRASIQPKDARAVGRHEHFPTFPKFQTANKTIPAYTFDTSNKQMTA